MLNRIFQVRVGVPYSNNNKKIVEWDVPYYWGGNDAFFIKQTESKELQNVFKLILKTQNTVTKGDVIYASKASEIPRFKLKEYIKDKGLKKTSRYNQADVVIINKGYFMDLIKEFKYSDYTFVNGDFIKSNHKEWSKGNTSKKNHIDKAMSEATDLDIVCMVEPHVVKDIDKIYNNNPTQRKEYDDNTYTVKGTFVALYRQERLKNLLTILYDLRNGIISGKTKIVFDEDMFVTLNNEGIELDEDYLKTLRDMLFSEDKSNVKLGFEMMSNLVLNQPTILSISFILNELYHQTNFRPSYYTNSNTNLKSLFKLLKTKGIAWERDWKTFGTGLRKNFKEGKEGAIVKKFLLDNINREFKLTDESAEYLVDIVFSTETQNINSVK